MLKRRTLVAFAATALLAAAPAFAQFADRTIKFTNGVNEDHPVGVGVKKMQEILAAKTGGKMKINAFWGGSAGNDLQATQALRAGTQEMVCTSSSPLVGIVKELGVFDLPFLFANEKEADAVLDGPAGQYFNKKLEEAGLVNLAYWENGFRNLTNSKRPVAKVEDFEGVKVRVMQNNIFLDTFKTLGTNAVPMAFPRSVHGARDQDHRRPGKPVRDHRDLEVQRSAEVPVGHPPRLHAVPGAVQQEAVGPAEPAGAVGAARGCHRRPEGAAHRQPPAEREVAGQPEGQGHDRQRRDAGRADAACSPRCSRSTPRTCRRSAPRR